jgi:hypothetical protein
MIVFRFAGSSARIGTHKVPYTDMSKLPKMTSAEQRAIRERMRAEFSFQPRPPIPEPVVASQPEAATAAPTGRRAEPAPADSPSAEPHASDHGEPADTWGGE